MMANFTFIGKVLPERATLNLPRPIAMRWKNASGENFNLSINIYANQIIAHFKYSDRAKVDLATARNIIDEHTQILVNLAGFLVGVCYDVEITSVLNNDTSDVQVFGRDFPVTRNKPQSRGNKFYELVPLPGMTSIVPLALADLRAAMRYPADTAVYCYRVFEAVLEDFKIPRGNQKQALNQIASDLNLGSGKELRSFLGKHANSRRHGKPVSISWSDRKAVMRRAWLVMDRYLEFLKRGRKPLPKSKFPIPKRY